MKEKRRDTRLFDLVCYRILEKNINIFNEKLINDLIWLQYDVANFIFSLKYRQRKVDLNAGEKSLVFVTKQHFIFKHSYRIRKFHIYARIRICGKDAAFLNFRLKESSESMIFP